MIAPIQSIPIDGSGSRSILVQRPETEGSALAHLLSVRDTRELTKALEDEEQKATESRYALLVENLGWTKEEAWEARARVCSFEDDWNAPGMEDYDLL